MRVLIACEESQEVCKAFRSLGHEAYSCDLVECSGGHPEWHIIGDVRVALRRNWDLIVAHPPCTYLAISGNRWFKDHPTRYKRRLDGIRFFFQFVFHNCPKIAIEQPKGIMSSVYRKPDQIIQPWQFGHGEVKATHLWLKGCPPPGSDRRSIWARGKNVEDVARSRPTKIKIKNLPWHCKSNGGTMGIVFNPPYTSN